VIEYSQQFLYFGILAFLSESNISNPLTKAVQAAQMLWQKSLPKPT
jgi:hypothetical protein